MQYDPETKELVQRLRAAYELVNSEVWPQAKAALEEKCKAIEALDAIPLESSFETIGQEVKTRVGAASLIRAFIQEKENDAASYLSTVNALQDTKPKLINYE